MERIAEIIKEIMKANGISLRALEKTTHISKSSLQRYLNGDVKKMPIDDFEALCKVLGIDPAETLGWVLKKDTDPSEIIAERIAALSPDLRDQVLNYTGYLESKQDK